MITLFISAFVLGVIFNAAPGSVFAESLRRGLQGGYHSALYVQFGSLIGDATWAILGLMGAGILFQIPAVRTPLTAAGAAYLAYLGLQSILSRHTTPSPQDDEIKRIAHRGAFAAGASLSLTNPANVFYWAALGGVLGGLGVDQPKTQHYAVFFIGFMASSIAWCFVCAGIIHMMHRTMSPTFVKFINWLAGAALLYLAIRTSFEIWQGF